MWYKARILTTCRLINPIPFILGFCMQHTLGGFYEYKTKSRFVVTWETFVDARRLVRFRTHRRVILVRRRWPKTAPGLTVLNPLDLTGGPRALCNPSLLHPFRCQWQRQRIQFELDGWQQLAWLTDWCFSSNSWSEMNHRPGNEILRQISQIIRSN